MLRQNDAFISESKDLKVYDNPEFGFSFKHTEDTNISDSSYGGGKLIIVKRNNPEEIFQIYIVNTGGEQVNITEDIIKRDIPDMSIANPQDVIIGESGKGIAFISIESNEQRREVWFNYTGHVYQITAPIDSDDFLKETLDTWQFKI